MSCTILGHVNTFVLFITDIDLQSYCKVLAKMCLLFIFSLINSYIHSLYFLYQIPTKKQKREYTIECHYINKSPNNQVRGKIKEHHILHTVHFVW